MTIKPPQSITPNVVTSTTVSTTASAKGPVVATQPQVNPEAVAKAFSEYKKLRGNLKKPFMSGAAGLFTDNVIFPQELLDHTNPANDSKYLHLLFAVFGLKDVVSYFASAEQFEEDESDVDEQSDSLA
ncbi:hypothetical protein K1X76_05015 [bacterium]|nr:hypothetical protein [bacterium]